MLNPGMVLQDRYHIQRRLGGGGMGTVYLADDGRLPGRRCAIKELSPENIPPAERNWAIQAFRQEAGMLAQLKHPGLTAVTDFFPEGGNWYLVMEFVEGETLEAYLQRAPNGRLPLAEALEIARQLCDVLEYLHSQNPPVVFRDLKPANIMLNQERQTKLIDFGIARHFKPGQTRDTMNLGTPGYAAPEQYGGLGQSDPRTDVYSLGAVLLQLVTGYNPVQAATPFPLPPPSQLVRDLPPPVEAAIGRAIQLQPEARFRSVAEFRQALFAPTALRKEQTMVMPQQPGSPPPGYPAQASTAVPARPVAQGGNKGVWIGVGLGLLLLGVCGVVVLGGVASGLLPIPNPFARPQSGATPLPAATSAVAPPVTTAPPVQTTAPPVTEAPLPTQATTAPPVTVAPVAPQPLRLAYVRGDVGNSDIYVANANGDEATCVACSACDEAEPDWSPDGTTLVYQSNCGGSYDLWTVRLGSSPVQLSRTPDWDEREPHWSPDGKQIIFRANPVGSGRNEDGTLWTVGADGSGARNLGVVGRVPVWSPDGRQVAYMSEQSGGWEIYLLELATNQSRRLTDCQANCRWPAWSPDGQSVVYHQTTAAGSTTAESIWAVPVSGGRATLIVSGDHAGRPDWSAEGLIVFNSDRGVEVVNPDGSGRRTLIGGEQNWAPTWSR